MFGIQICYFNKIRTAIFNEEFPTFQNLMDKIHEELYPTHDEAITDWAYLIMYETNAPNEKVMIMSDQELEFYLRWFKAKNQIPNFHIWFDEGH